jgi:hypothetical protein
MIDRGTLAGTGSLHSAPLRSAPLIVLRVDPPSLVPANARLWRPLRIATLGAELRFADVEQFVGSTSFFFAPLRPCAFAFSSLNRP